jgi:hypothetical protein
MFKLQFLRVVLNYANSRQHEGVSLSHPKTICETRNTMLCDDLFALHDYSYIQEVQISRGA